MEEQFDAEDMQQVAEQSTERVGDYIVDAETGEITGIAAQDHFKVVDLASFEWVMEKMQQHDSNALALKLRCQAIIANIDRQIRYEQNARTFLEMRFGPELIEYAHQNLPRKRKTFTTPFGSVSFKDKPGSFKILDMAAAVKWCKDMELADKIRTEESVLASEIEDVALAEREAVCLVCSGTKTITIIDSGEVVTCSNCNGFGTVNRLPSGDVFEIKDKRKDVPKIDTGVR